VSKAKGHLLLLPYVWNSPWLRVCISEKKKKGGEGRKSREMKEGEGGLAKPKAAQAPVLKMKRTVGALERTLSIKENTRKGGKRANQDKRKKRKGCARVKRATFEGGGKSRDEGAMNIIANEAEQQARNE